MRAFDRDQVPVVIEGGGVEVRLTEIGGGMSAAFIRLPRGTDLGPALVGLDGDACQAPHWGYLRSGRLLMRSKGGDSVYTAGQAFYWAPGHVPVALEDTEYVDFSPTEEFLPVVQHIRAGAAG